MLKPSPASSVGTGAGTDLAAAGPGKEGWSSLQGGETPGSHTLTQAVPSSRMPSVPPLKQLLQSSRAQMKHLPSVGALLCPQAQWSFSSDGLLWALCALLPLYSPCS